MRFPRLALAVAVALFGLSATGDRAVAQERCGVCHPEQRVRFASSLHAREEVSCTECHGGDAATLDADRAHRGRFRSLSDRAMVPAVCAECHSDPSRMQPYNLPVDQYAVYLTSQHGRAVLGGERRAAICTDCHGAHGTLAPDDPDSLAHPTRIAATCGSCHSDPVLMRAFDLDPTVVDSYVSSIHARTLLEAGNPAAPDCTSCHGVHGATPPGVGDIDKVCGACHQQTRRAFLEGPHRQGFEEAGEPECASCHSSHAIEPLTLDDVVDGLCTDCHGDDSEQAALGQRIHSLVHGAATEIERAEGLVERAARSALHTDDYLSRLEQARTYVTEALPLVHMVTLEPIESLSRRALSIVDEVEREIDDELDRTEERVGLAVFWFYLIMTLVILTLLKRRLRARSEIP